MTCTVLIECDGCVNYINTSYTINPWSLGALNHNELLYEDLQLHSIVSSRLTYKQILRFYVS